MFKVYLDYLTIELADDPYTQRESGAEKLEVGAAVVLSVIEGKQDGDVGKAVHKSDVCL